MLPYPKSSPFPPSPLLLGPRRPAHCLGTPAIAAPPSTPEGPVCEEEESELQEGWVGLTWGGQEPREGKKDMYRRMHMLAIVAMVQEAAEVLQVGKVHKLQSQ